MFGDHCGRHQTKKTGGHVSVFKVFWAARVQVDVSIFLGRAVVVTSGVTLHQKPDLMWPSQVFVVVCL